MAKLFGRICVAVAVGFMGAIPFADTARITAERDVAVPIAGVILGFLTLTAFVFGEIQLRNLMSRRINVEAAVNEECGPLQRWGQRTFRRWTGG